MAPVAFSHEWKRRVEDQMASGERIAELHATLVQLRDPEYVTGARLVPVVTQPWGHRGYDWYDAAAIVEEATLADAGLVAIASLGLGAPPGRDREREVNEERLDQLEQPFSASFLGGSGDNDGATSWASPIELTHQQGDGSPIVLRYPPGTVPLEVGHVQPETVLWHLRYSGGVARWPYGSPHLTLLLTTRRFTESTGGRAFKPELLSGRRVADTMDSVS